MPRNCDKCADSPNLCLGNPLSRKCKYFVEKVEDVPIREETPHFYIRGNVLCKMRKVIEKLVVKGGINKFNYKGCDPYYIYYIGPHDNVIYKLPVESPEFKNFLYNWIELD